MTQEDKIIELNPKESIPTPTTEEVEAELAKLEFDPSALIWKNFRKEQPDVDRQIILFCPMGRITPNLILTHRDPVGNYDLPHPTKRYNALAWAYVDLPKVTPKQEAQ